MSELPARVRSRFRDRPIVATLRPRRQASALASRRPDYQGRTRGQRFRDGRYGHRRLGAWRIGTVTQGSPFRPRSTSHQMYRVRSAALEMPLYSGGSALLSLSAARQGESRQSAHGTPFGLPKISRICLACGMSAHGAEQLHRLRRPCVRRRSLNASGTAALGGKNP